MLVEYEHKFLNARPSYDRSTTLLRVHFNVPDGFASKGSTCFVCSKMVYIDTGTWRVTLDGAIIRSPGRKASATQFINGGHIDVARVTKKLSSLVLVLLPLHRKKATWPVDSSSRSRRALAMHPLLLVRCRDGSFFRAGLTKLVATTAMLLMVSRTEICFGRV